VHRAIFALALLVPVLGRAQSELMEVPVSSVNALQNRAYRLQHEFTVVAGFLPTDPYTKGVFAQAGYAFHVNDLFGIQARGAFALPLPTQLRRQLERDFEVLPNQFSRVSFFAGGDVLFRPLYGKLSFLNFGVVHGEVHLLAGVSAFGFTDEQTLSPRPAINVGGGGRAYLGQNVSLRLDLVNHFVFDSFTELLRLLGVVAGPSSGRAVTNVLSLTLGVAITFGGTE